MRETFDCDVYVTFFSVVTLLLTFYMVYIVVNFPLLNHYEVMLQHDQATQPAYIVVNFPLLNHYGVRLQHDQAA